MVADRPFPRAICQWHIVHLVFDEFIHLRFQLEWDNASERRDRDLDVGSPVLKIKGSVAGTIIS